MTWACVMPNSPPVLSVSYPNMETHLAPKLTAEDEKWKKYSKLVKDLYISTDGKKTFQFDETLPPLPVPDLDSTLAKYLESAAPHISDSEYEELKRLIEDFRKGIGKELQRALLKRASQHSNWLEQWWEEEVYLKMRYPVIPFNTMLGAFAVIDPDEGGYSIDPEVTFQVNFCPSFVTSIPKEFSLFLHFILEFWNLLREEKLKPQANHRDQKWSMHQFHRLFSCSQIPNKSMDSFAQYFKTKCQGEAPRHVMIFCNGHIFSCVPFNDKDDPLTPPEWEALILNVWEASLKLGMGHCVAALCCQDRNKWAKDRAHLAHLSEKNRAILTDIDSAIFSLVLDGSKPQDADETLWHAVGGDISNKWADKSVTFILHRNGQRSMIANHSPFDALTTVMATDFAHKCSRHLEFRWKGPWAIRTHLIQPQRRELDIDALLVSSIAETIQASQKLVAMINICRFCFSHFGKSYLKTVKCHPDAFIQVAIQAGYVKLHGRPGATYETATTRTFYHGRTETCRTCTKESVDFARALLDSNKKEGELHSMLMKALAKHMALMEEAQNGQGCDRHLFGLCRIAEELGLSQHPIFTHPSWKRSGGDGNFILSTSLTGYTENSGCMVAMCEDGYGVFYNILPSSIYFGMTSWKQCPYTDIKRLYGSIEGALVRMQQIVSSRGHL
ncbi:unnamed protein product [Darwinula stevensoni]|uniref:Choline/carnitine acyltransferase domain-containing protein n=1 Tax=Darwinula stevensoni TaxID=69355 RepID=A0A7R9A5E9_9CRUS|nr:unnamed protein product [Darwinula stevensoni]CAG0894270.1 unnamed protein product [Darwinula stevensoni]